MESTITTKAVLLLVFTLLAPSLTSAAFVFEFEVVSYVTNGDCFGIDFTIPCETFVDDFCLRGPAYFNGQDGDLSQCPLGANSQAVYGVPQTRSITSNLPWPGVFQLLVRALDDDSPFTTHDHLDNIFIDQSAVPSSLYSPLTNFPGVNNKVSVNLRYRVNCQQNFYGTTCFEYCVASDDDFEGHYTCDPTSGSVICRDGYEHPETLCVDPITACSSFPCQQGAPCTPIGLSDFTCSCPAGYTGRMCEGEVDECVPNPCSNGGNCTDLLADYLCTCLPGYSGKNCTLNIDECLGAECVGNASCIDGINEYTCVCNHGFEGMNCTEINPCDTSPCAATGTCVPMSPFEYTCLCEPGYTDPICATDIDECVNTTCPQNSNCVDEVNSYSCVCLNGFEGPQCNVSTLTSAGAASNSPVWAIGAAVGCLVVFIVIILIVILIIAIVLAKSRRRKSHYTFTDRLSPETPTNQEGENPYEIQDGIVQSTDPLINNPLYGTPFSSPEREFNSTNLLPTSNVPTSTNPSYLTSPAHTLRKVDNPLYGDTLSPTHNNGPIYSEPLHGNPTATPQKGSANYPYSYAVVDKDRRTSSKKVSNGSIIKAPPPNYEEATLDAKVVVPARNGPHYEDVVFKDELSSNGKVTSGSEADRNTYATPKPILSPAVDSQAPLVYHYATGETSTRTTNIETSSDRKPPLLGAAVAKSREGPPKKSIYDSQDESVELANGTTGMPSKPVPPPRTKPAVPQKPTVYSYAITNSSSPNGGKRSIKINPEPEGSSDQTGAPYNKLEHDLGPGVPGHQERMAKIEGSGYEALQ